jgi:hypothetical protein
MVAELSWAELSWAELSWVRFAFAESLCCFCWDLCCSCCVLLSHVLLSHWLLSSLLLLSPLLLRFFFFFFFETLPLRGFRVDSDLNLSPPSWLESWFNVVYRLVPRSGTLQKHPRSWCARSIHTYCQDPQCMCSAMHYINSSRCDTTPLGQQLFSCFLGDRMNTNP